MKSNKENNELNILNKKEEPISEKKSSIKFPQFSFKSNRRNKIETIDFNENKEIKEIKENKDTKEKENKLITLEEKIKPNNIINIFEDNNKKDNNNNNNKDNNTNTNNKNESIEKSGDKKEDLLFNPINIDDDEKDGVDDFDNLEEFII